VLFVRLRDKGKKDYVPVVSQASPPLMPKRLLDRHPWLESKPPRQMMVAEKFDSASRATTLLKKKAGNRRSARKEDSA